MDFVERNQYRGFGQPVLKERRINVISVISYAAFTDNISAYLEEFEISVEELKSAVIYCNCLECKNSRHEWEKYCDGCVLRAFADGWRLQNKEENKRPLVFLCKNIADEIDEFGLIGWQLAKKVKARIL